MDTNRKQQLIEIMRTRAEELGRTPRVKDFMKGSPGWSKKLPSYMMFVREFGSFRAAQEAAELQSRERGRPREELAT